MNRLRVREPSLKNGTEYDKFLEEAFYEIVNRDSRTFYVECVMEKVKKIIILIVLVVIGYFAYVNFFASTDDDVSDETNGTYEASEATPADQLSPIPDSCQTQAKNFENAIYGAATGQSSFAQRNNASRVFAQCLSDAGFSEAQIQGTIAQIQQRVDGLAKKDGH
jgi:hypothetical protein